MELILRKPSGGMTIEEVISLNHNRPSAYIVPADTFEAMLEKLDDLEIRKTIRKRRGEKSVPISLDAL